MEDSSDEVGYLSFSLISVDYKIENIAPTKGIVPATDLPELEDFTVRIDGPIDEPIVYGPGEIPSVKVTLPVGTYNVEAIYGSNDFCTPYFYETKSITISQKEDACISFVGITMGNAMLAIRLSSDVSQHLNISKIQLSDGIKTVDISPDVYVYVPSQRGITMTIIGTNSTNEEKKIDIPLGEMKPKHAYDITCNLSSLPQIVLPDQSAGAWATRLYVTPATIDASLPSDQVIYEVTSSDWNSLTAVSEKISDGYHVVKGLENGSTYKVRARVGNVVSNEVSFKVEEFRPGATYNIAHDYDSEFLTGTSVTADLKLTGILATLYDKGLIETSITLKKGDEVYRTLNTPSGKLTDPNDWPYIPKGTSYTLEVSHNIKGQSDPVKSTLTSIGVPAPAISVDVSAYTTYDWYKAGNLTNANNYDKRLVVEDRKAVLKISNNILQNTKYTSLLTASSVKYDNVGMTSFAISSTASNTLTYDEPVTYNDSQWGSYPFTAAVTFDGINATDTHDCWITGLPYSINFYNNESGLDNSAWTQNNIEYSNNKCCITYNGSNGYLISPKFQVPAGINVKNTVQAQAYRAGASPYNAKLRIGLTSSANSVASSYNEYSLSPNVNTGQSYETVSPEFTLTPNSPYISLHHNTPSKHWTMAWVYICIYQCSVEYKL